MSENGSAAELTQAEVAHRLGITTRQARRLDFPRLKNKKYPWPAARDWYIAFKQDERLKRHAGHGGSDYERARARKVAAQAELAEIEVAKLRGMLVAVGDVETMVRDPLDRVDAKLLAVPGKWAPQILGLSSIPEGMRRLQRIVDEIRDELRRIAEDDPDVRDATARA